MAEVATRPLARHSPKMTQKTGLRAEKKRGEGSDSSVCAGNKCAVTAGYEDGDSQGSSGVGAGIQQGAGLIAERCPRDTYEHRPVRSGRGC